MSKTIIALLLSCLISSPVFGYPAHAQYWPHRSVLYFAPANDDHEALMNECELEDRDVITLVIAEDGFTEPSWLKEEFDLKMLAALYEVKAGQHTAILLGKDGEEKHRWGAKTDWQFINNLIDEMPMRKREMQQKRNPCAI
jgi:hypothetical protein